MTVDGIHEMSLYAQYSHHSFVYTEDFNVNIIPFIIPPATAPDDIFYVIGTPMQTIPFTDLDYSNGIPVGKSLTNI